MNSTARIAPRIAPLALATVLAYLEKSHHERATLPPRSPATIPSNIPGGMPSSIPTALPTPFSTRLRNVISDAPPIVTPTVNPEIAATRQRTSNTLTGPLSWIDTTAVVQYAAAR